MKEKSCPGCGAPRFKNTVQCEYCGRQYKRSSSKKKRSSTEDSNGYFLPEGWSKGWEVEWWDIPPKYVIMREKENLKINEMNVFNTRKKLDDAIDLAKSYNKLEFGNLMFKLPEELIWGKYGVYDRIAKKWVYRAS